MYNKMALIKDLSWIYFQLLTNFVDVDFWQNFGVECSENAGKSVDLHFVWEGPGVFLLCQWEIQCYLIYLYKGHRVGGHKCVGCKFGLFWAVELYIVGPKG